MPCNCEKRKTPFRNYAPRRLQRNINQTIEKKNYDSEISTTDNSVISSIDITGGSLHINYKGGSGPTPPQPSSKAFQGYLNNTAYKALTSNGGTLGKGEYRSIGYYGVGFGGNIEDGGAYASKLRLDQLDLKTYTDINVAFFAISPKGDLVYPGGSSGNRGGGGGGSQPAWLQDVLKGVDGGKEQALAIMKALNNQINVYKNANKGYNCPCLLPSIGGWDIANNEIYGKALNSVAADIQKNSTSGTLSKNYSNSIKAMMEFENVCGIDVDWEYPGRDPLVTYCTKSAETSDPGSFPCQIGEPTKIGPCSDGDKGCISYATMKGWDGKQNKNNCECTKNGNTFMVPKNDGLDVDNYTADLNTNYTAFMTTTKEIIKEKRPSDGILTIAMAGAPWGWHWSADTISNLIIKGTIDFANIMAYDYNGWWNSGYTSGFLGNLYNQTDITACNPDFLSKGLCQYAGGCQNAAPSDEKATGCPYQESNCYDKYFITYKAENGKLRFDTNKGLGCPLTYYNVFVDSGSSDITPEQKTQWCGPTENDGIWWSDNGEVEGNLKAMTSPCGNNAGVGWGGRLTLSIDSMVQAYNKIFNIPLKKLVLGLPYYGRTFQTKAGQFYNGTYGLYQPYYIGGPYSYYDIHKRFIKDLKGADVYDIKLNDQYNENIIYNKDVKAQNKLRSDMEEEFVSYGSEQTTKDKIEYVVKHQLGGYMAWHMLSDYYPDAAKASEVINSDLGTEQGY